MPKLNTICYAVIAAVIILISACAKDKKTPAPLTDTRNQYIGTWRCYEKSTLGSTFIPITISKDTINQVYIRIYNFRNLGPTIFANAIIDYTNISIPQQQITGAGGSYTIQGSGQFLSNQLNLTYTSSDGVDVTNYTATCLKN